MKVTKIEILPSDSVFVRTDVGDFDRYGPNDWIERVSLAEKVAVYDVVRERKLEKAFREFVTQPIQVTGIEGWEPTL